MGKIYSPSRRYYECGICGAYHAVEWNGDCRQDNARLDPEELDQRHQALGNITWREVRMPTW